MRAAGPLPFLLLFVLAGCASAPLPESTFEPPELCAVEDDACYLRIADAYARHVMGERYAARHLRNPNLTREPVHDFCIADPSNCVYTVELVHVVYGFRAEGAPFVDEQAELIITTDDSRVRDGGGFPYCRERPSECAFPFDENDALAIARRAGLAEGIAPWETSFHYYNGDTRELRTYVWTVSNTTSGDPRGNAQGTGIIIDANSGQILMRNGWASTVD